MNLPPKLCIALVVALACLVGSCAPAASNLRAGLLAYYPFDGSTADASGHLNDGIPHGVVPGRDAAGAPGNAFAFDGETSRILLPDNLVAEQASLSVTLWFKTTAAGVLLGYQSEPYPLHPPAKYVPALYVGLDGHAYAEFWNGKAEPLRSAAAVNDGAWHFLALTGDAAVQTLILDGKVAGTMSGMLDQHGMASTQLGIGNTGVGNFRGWPSGNDAWFAFKGTIDNVRIYGRALPLAECRVLYRAGI
jgi:hypothetical protein